MITATIYHAFSELKNNWKLLEKELPVFYPFLTWEWQNTWWEIGGKAKLFNIQINDDEKILGIGSFRIENDIVYWSCNEEVSDYLDLIGNEKNNSILWKKIIEELRKQNLKKIILRNIPEKSASRKSLNELAQRGSYTFSEEKEDVVPAINLPSSYDEYLQLLSRKNRHELRRKWRRFEHEAESSWEIIKSEKSLLENDCRSFFDLFVKGGEGKKTFLTKEMEEFFCRETEAMAGLGLLDFTTLKIKNRTAAQTIAFKTKERYFLFNMAVEPDFLHLSPGLIINKLLIEDGIKNGMKIYDFMQGNEHYKYQLGAKDEYIYKINLEL